MKKILSFIVIFISVFFVAGCNLSSKLNKEPLKAEEFKSTMERKGYSILDASGQFTQDYIKKVYLAVSSSSTYQIEFYELDTEKNAKDFYDINKKIFEDSKDSTNVESFVELGNHAKYTLKSGGTYKVISRISNTIVYLNVSEEYRSEVNDMIKSIGY